MRDLSLENGDLPRVYVAYALKYDELYMNRYYVKLSTVLTEIAVIRFCTTNSLWPSFLKYYSDSRLSFLSIKLIQGNMNYFSKPEVLISLITRVCLRFKTI